MRGNYDASGDSRDSWIKLVEIFPECKITYATDKLMAMPGLVQHKRAQRCRYHDWKNVLGLWKEMSHVDLLWVSRPRKLSFLSALRLPPWTWVAYAGPITFVKIGDPCQSLTPLNVIRCRRFRWTLLKFRITQRGCHSNRGHRLPSAQL
jgi:hypothetical protein